MYNRMKTLVLLQLDNRYRYKSKRALIAKLAVKTGVFAVCTLVMFGVLYLLKYVVNLPVTKDFLLFVLALSQYVGIAVTTTQYCLLFPQSTRRFFTASLPCFT